MSIDKKQLTEDIIAALKRTLIYAAEHGTKTIVFPVDDAKALIDYYNDAKTMADYYNDAKTPKPAEYQYVVINGKLGDEIYVKDPKDGGYTAYFKDYPQMVTEGNTINDAQDRLWGTAYDTFRFLLGNKK